MASVPRRSAVSASIVAVVASCGVVSAFACGDIVSIQGEAAASTEGLGSFAGALEWSYLGGPTGTLTISLTNTNYAATGGFITAFAFNIDALSPSASMLSSDNSNFGQISNVNAMPFGMDFLTGASTGGSFQGGGNPSGGIGVGQTAAFEFSIAASNLGDLSAMSFLGGPYDHNFVVRFRGFADGGSDKVPATLTSDPIPGPGAIGALAFAGFCPKRRRRNA